MIPSLSILELFIIAAIQRLKKQQQQEVNFTMVWKEYCKLKECSREGHVDSQYNRAAASRAFERLLQLGLIAYSRSRYAAPTAVRVCFAKVFHQACSDGYQHLAKQLVATITVNCPTVFPLHVQSLGTDKDSVQAKAKAKVQNIGVHEHFVKHCIMSHSVKVANLRSTLHHSFTVPFAGCTTKACFGTLSLCGLHLQTTNCSKAWKSTVAALHSY